MADPSQSWGGAGGLAGGPTGGMVQKLVVTAGGMALAYQTGWLPALLRYSAVGSAMMLGVIFTQQSSMLYQNNVPQLPKSPRDPRLPPEMRLSPDARGLPFEDLRDSQLLSALDGEPPVRLHGWLLLQPLPLRERAPTLIYSHGNAGNIAFRMDDLERQYRTLGANILIYDYRGYGDSEGTPSEAGLIADAEACLRYLRSRDDIDKDRIVAFGRSLGGAVSLALARNHPSELRAGETSLTAHLSFFKKKTDPGGAGFLCLSLAHFLFEIKNRAGSFLCLSLSHCPFLKNSGRVYVSHFSFHPTCHSPFPLDVTRMLPIRLLLFWTNQSSSRTPSSLTHSRTN